MAYRCSLTGVYILSSLSLSPLGQAETSRAFRAFHRLRIQSGELALVVCLAWWKWYSRKIKLDSSHRLGRFPHSSSMKPTQARWEEKSANQISSNGMRKGEWEWEWEKEKASLGLTLSFNLGLSWYSNFIAFHLLIGMTFPPPPAPIPLIWIAWFCLIEKNNGSRWIILVSFSLTQVFNLFSSLLLTECDFSRPESYLNSGPLLSSSWSLSSPSCSVSYHHICITFTSSLPSQMSRYSSLLESRYPLSIPLALPCTCLARFLLLAASESQLKALKS